MVQWWTKLSQDREVLGSNPAIHQFSSKSYPCSQLAWSSLILNINERGKMSSVHAKICKLWRLKKQNNNRPTGTLFQVVERWTTDTKDPTRIPNLQSVSLFASLLFCNSSLPLARVLYGLDQRYQASAVHCSLQPPCWLTLATSRIQKKSWERQ